MQQAKKRLRRDKHSKGLQVFRGAQEVIEAAIELLTTAGSPQQDGEILLTFQGTTDVFDKVPTLRQEWWRGIQATAEQGWKVTHLIRISEDPAQLLAFVGDIIDYISARSEYTPYYFHQYGTLSPPYDILVVPEHGAMQLYATDQPDYVDTAVFSPDPLFAQTLSGHFQQLFAPDKISPLMKMYTSDMLSAYEVITNFELEPGERFLIQPALSALTRPKSFLSEDGRWAQVIKARDSDPTKLLELYRQRVKAFEKQVGEHLFRDICSKRAVERLRDEGEYDRQGLYLEDEQERIDHLENVINLLAHPNYELALLDETEEHLLPLATFVVKPHAVLLDTYPDVQGNPYAQIEIREPMIVQGFSGYFTYLWNQIKEENKNKDRIIAWLEEEITNIHRHQNW